MESVEYEPAWALGANCGNDDVAPVAKLIDQCNDYGMDTIEIGNVALGAHGGDRARVHRRRPRELAWGDADAMVESVRR